MWQASRLSGEDAACRCKCIFDSLSPVTQDRGLVFTYADLIALPILAVHLNTWMHHSRLVHLFSSSMFELLLYYNCTFAIESGHLSIARKHAFWLFFVVDGINEIHQWWRRRCAGGSKSCADSVHTIKCVNYVFVVNLESFQKKNIEIIVQIVKVNPQGSTQDRQSQEISVRFWYHRISFSEILNL